VTLEAERVTTLPASPVAVARAFAVKVMGGAALQAVTALIYGGATVLVARQVGPATFGALATATTIALVGGDVLDLGRTSALVRLQAQGLVPTAVLARRLILAKLAWSPALLAVLAATSLLLTHHLHVYMLAFYLYAVGYTTWQTLVTPQRGEAQLMQVSSCAAQERLVTLVVILATLPFIGPSSLPIGLAVGSLSVCARLVRSARAGLRPGPPPLSASEFRRSARGFAVVSLTSDAQQLDVPLVAAVGGTASAGIFAAASRLIGPLSMVVTQTSQLVFARASRTDDPLTRRQAAFFVGGIAAVFVPGLLLVCWRSHDLVGILLGDQYRESAGLLWLLSLGILLTIVTNPLTAWIQGRGRSRVAALASTLALVVYFVVLLLGALHDSLTVVALAYSAMHLVNFVIMGTNIALRRVGIIRPVPGRHRA
jgi:O-antigen/teichoic acid export membrane protein